MMGDIISSARPSFPEHLRSQQLSVGTLGFILLLSALVCVGSFEARCIYFDYFCQIMSSLRSNKEKKIFVFHPERTRRCLLAAFSLKSSRLKCGSGITTALS